MSTHLKKAGEKEEAVKQNPANAANSVRKSNNEKHAAVGLKPAGKEAAKTTNRSRKEDTY